MPSRFDPHTDSGDNEPDKDRNEFIDDDATTLLQRYVAERELEQDQVTHYGDPHDRKRVVVSTPDGAEELCIVDRTYALVATGVGRLDVMLPEGEYQLRQRVGEDERIETFVVGPGDGEQVVALAPLQFSTPVPVEGSTFIGPLRNESYRVDAALGNFRLLLWAPDGGAALEGSELARNRVDEQLRRFHLEDFSTGEIRPFEVIPPSTANGANALVAMHLTPGAYVLTQQTTPGRQRCLPIWIRPNLVTAVYLLALQVSGKAQPVNLDHAAVVMMPAEDFHRCSGSSILQLEAARKALSLGRPVHGWTMHAFATSYEPSVKNPLLFLMDAQLLAGQLNAVMQCTAAAADVLGEDFPDVVALETLTRANQPDMQRKPLAISGPPILRRSWGQLLATPDGNAELGKLMAFAFQVDGVGAWLLWSEDIGSRKTRSNPPTVEPDGLRGEIARAVALVRGNLMGRLVGKGISVLRERLQGEFRNSDSPTTAQDSSVTVDKVVEMLVALSDSGMLQRLLATGQKVIADQGLKVDQESMRQLLGSLHVLLNGTLVKLIGAEALVRRAFADLDLPEERIVSLVRSLVGTLLEKVSVQDRTLAMDSLKSVLLLTDEWVKAYTPTPNLPPVSNRDD